MTFKKQNVRLVSIIAYLLIIIAGFMIGMPLFFWLPSLLFSFGDIDQFMSILAITGLIICYKTRYSLRTWTTIVIDILVFILLNSILIKILYVAGIEKLNYFAFTIPFSIFVLFYIISIFLKPTPRKTENEAVL